MKRFQGNQLDMFLVVDNVLQKHTSVWSSLAAMQTAVNDFRTALTAVTTSLEQQVIPITGYRQDKRKALLAMVELALQVRGSVMAYADTIADNVLKDGINFSYTKLVKVSDTVSAERCQIIKDTAQNHLSQLGAYGVNQSLLNQLQQLIDLYQSKIPSTRVAITKRKLATRNLKRYIKETSLILKDRMDKLMYYFKASHPDFYAVYFNARIIVDLKTTARKKKAKV